MGADFNLEICFGKDKRKKLMKYDECAYGNFIRKLQKMFQLDAPVMNHYKIWYQLESKFYMFCLRLISKIRLNGYA